MNFDFSSLLIYSFRKQELLSRLDYIIKLVEFLHVIFINVDFTINYVFFKFFNFFQVFLEAVSWDYFLFPVSKDHFFMLLAHASSVKLVLIVGLL